MMRYHRVQGMPSAFAVIKTPRRISLQVHGELMEVLGDLVIVVEILIEIDFAVAIEIMKANNLISAGNVDLTIYNLQAERLK